MVLVRISFSTLIYHNSCKMSSEDNKRCFCCHLGYLGFGWLLLFFFLRQGVTLFPRLECSGEISAPPPGIKWFPVSASRVAGTAGVSHHAWLIFCIFNRDGVTPCWLGWSWTSDFRWSTRLGLPKCWDYNCEPPHQAFLTFLICGLDS